MPPSLSTNNPINCVLNLVLKIYRIYIYIYIYIYIRMTVTSPENDKRVGWGSQMWAFFVFGTVNEASLDLPLNEPLMNSHLS